MNKGEDNRLHFIDQSWDGLNEVLHEKKYSKVFVLVDTNTFKHCLSELSIALEVDFQVLEIEPGEASKDLEICAHLWVELSEEKADRNALLICLGGGVVCDLGAFIASIYKRGIDFIHVPTSLLAMVDASIGGKNGIDFMGYKNQLGLIREAEAIFLYPGFLKTLDKIELQSGFAEMLKHGLILDKAHWDFLSGLDSLAIEELKMGIAASMQVKQAIVANDPNELGERKKLNFGHTIGHAIESHFLKESKPIPHGFAVAAGMYIESYLSQQKLGLSPESFEEISLQIERHYSKLNINSGDIPSIIAFMEQDKKRVDNVHQLTLLREIGKAEINQVCNQEEIEAGLVHYIHSYGT